MSDEIHITSFVVYMNPAKKEQVYQGLNAIAGLEVHAESPDGKLVVTLESSTNRAMLDQIDSINAVEGVINSALVYHEVA